VKRAQYDNQHKDHSGFRWKLVNEASDSKGIERDVDMQNRLLSILYVKRRQNIRDPGIGNFELERLLGCPAEPCVVSERKRLGKGNGKRHTRDHGRGRRSRQFRPSSQPPPQATDG
jgi:hypothetical protein